MKLWIRSQDKETLRTAATLDIYDLSDDEGQCWVIEECGIDIGHYKSKERALEVLDEIQEYIEKQGINELITNKQGIIEEAKYYGKIYEMPKE